MVTCERVYSHQAVVSGSPGRLTNLEHLPVGLELVPAAPATAPFASRHVKAQVSHWPLRLPLSELPLNTVSRKDWGNQV